MLYKFVSGLGFVWVVFQLLVWLLHIIKHLLGFWFGRLRPRTAGEYALITGGTDGIGKQYARQLYKRGFHLFLIGRSSEKLQRVKGELMKEGPGKIDIFIRDLSADLKVYIERLRKQIKELPIGVVVVAAGVASHKPFVSPETDRCQDFDDVQRIIQVNMLSHMATVTAVAPQMMRRGSGTIVLITSIAAFAPTQGAAVYTCTKAGMEQFALCVRPTFEKYNVKLQVVHPAYVKSKLMPAERRKEDRYDIVSAEHFAERAVRLIGVVDETGGVLRHSILVAITKFLKISLPTNWFVQIFDVLHADVADYVSA